MWTASPEFFQRCTKEKNLCRGGAQTYDPLQRSNWVHREKKSYKRERVGWWGVGGLVSIQTKRPWALHSVKTHTTAGNLRPVINKQEKIAIFSIKEPVEIIYCDSKQKDCFITYYVIVPRGKIFEGFLLLQKSILRAKSPSLTHTRQWEGLIYPSRESFISKPDWKINRMGGGGKSFPQKSPLLEIIRKKVFINMSLK